MQRTLPMARPKPKASDAGKAWNRKASRTNPYDPNRKEKRKSFLIFCEGENTEPLYFKSFPVSNASVEVLGMGRSRTQLVNEVVKYRKRYPDLHGQEVWIVFDLDMNEAQRSFLEQDFNAAIALADQHGFKAAWSNDSFELWFVLHYHSPDAPLLRSQLYRMITQVWGESYERHGKRRDYCRGIYQRLAKDSAASQALAIQRAEKLQDRHRSLPFCHQNPGTTVHELVLELNRYIK